MVIECKFLLATCNPVRCLVTFSFTSWMNSVFNLILRKIFEHNTRYRVRLLTLSWFKWSLAQQKIFSRICHERQQAQVEIGDPSPLAPGRHVYFQPLLYFCRFPIFKFDPSVHLIRSSSSTCWRFFSYGCHAVMDFPKRDLAKWNAEGMK